MTDNSNNNDDRYHDDENSLYALMPSIYRQMEADIPGSTRPKPLKELLKIIQEQVAVVESDIGRLYDNWFIETCQEWVVPYIGDLLGVKGIRPVNSDDSSSFSQRAWVANTLSHRRRKGTLAVLEQLAHDVTDWDAKVVEVFQQLATAQNTNHIRPEITVADMRQAGRLDLVDTPFDTCARTADMRHIASRRGFYNIPNIAIFIWRLQAFGVEDAPAFSQGGGRFSFSQLGLDMPLFNSPESEEDATHLAQERNLPVPIRRRALHENPALYYGRDRSIGVSVKGVDIDVGRIVACDLTDWKNRPAPGKVAVDPVLGRILFPAGENPDVVKVSYYYGFAGEIGAGTYTQQEPAPTKAGEDGQDDGGAVNLHYHYYVSKRDPNPSENRYASMSAAMDEWKGKPGEVTFEIIDNEVYEEPIEISIPPGSRVVIRASEGKRPVMNLAKPFLIIPPPTQAAPAGGGTEEVVGEQEKSAQVSLEWLLVQCKEKDSAVVLVKGGDLDDLRVSHCTLVPGSSAGIKVQGGNDQLKVNLYRTICGSVQMSDTDALLYAKDSIIDSTSPNLAAISCYSARIENCTVFGSTGVAVIDLASNSIFTGPVVAERLQKGCIRFCYIPKIGSRVPRKYRCQPTTSSATAAAAVTGDSPSEVKPYFTSETFGEPGYAQLHANSDKEIAEGADNGNEMGVFNHLYQKYRLGNLTACFDEYLRFGMEAGVFLVT